MSRRLSDRRGRLVAVATQVVNPLVRRAVAAGVAPSGYTVLETVGRRSGLARQTPVGHTRSGDVVWIVAEHGRRAAYVRNIEANPRVRVHVGGRWRTGTARTVPGDDPHERLRAAGAVEAAVVRALGTDLLTVRVDLDATASSGVPSRGRELLGDAAAAGLVAAGLSGVPSTLHALATRGDVLEATVAAGSIARPAEQRRSRLVLAAVPVHLTLSLGWSAVFAVVLPRRRTAAWGGLAGLLVAALDLGVVGRRFPRIQALPTAPQVADHLAFGVVTGWVLERRRRPRDRNS